MTRHTKEVEDYYKKVLGVVPDFVKPLLEHAPGIMAGYLQMRKWVFEDKPKEGLSLAVKELLCVCVDCTTVNIPGAKAHARAAMKAGATLTQLAEMLGIVVIGTGMANMWIVGTEAFKAAEEYLKEKRR